MRKFLYKSLFFSIPFIVLVCGLVYLDFFKVFHFGDYYGPNQMVTLNREMITTKTYTHNRKNQSYNSFIFGSSRSQAYKANVWSKFLSTNSKSFHFDASWESIIGIYLKIKFIDSSGDRIKNALVILDEDILGQTSLKLGHLYIPLPELSQRKKTEFYFTYFQASLNPMFLASYIYYTLTNEYKDWMGMYVTPTQKDKFYGDDKTGDIYYPQDAMIIRDSVGYYERLKHNGTFNIKKNTDKKFNYVKIQGLLDSIQRIFVKHKTNYKIIISPNFDKKHIDAKLYHLLESKFGKSNVFDFSGENKYTTDISNYYESSHHRPILANEIMKQVYKSKNHLNSK